ncbi:MAG TPA: serpin family protein [Nocardioides sp.]|nr:serpin family protein [Nocardioides sp.]
MMGRRDLIRAGALGLLLTSAGGLMEACGSSPKQPAIDTSTEGGIRLVSADVQRATADPALLAPVVTGLERFGARLYDAVAGQPGNLVISPYSVAIALSMTLAGARGTTASQLASVLGADALGDRWHDGMNTLTSYVDGLAGPVQRQDRSKATIGLATADALFGQQGEAWQKAFLEVLARDYGAGMRTVDYRSDPDKVADLISGWVADRTDQRITNLIPHGVLTRDDRLTLVNAVSLTAPWEKPFEKSLTRPGDFHRADGSTVQAPMMTQSDVEVRLTSGPGWQAARIPYAGSTLAMTVVLPADGRFGEVEAALASGGLTAALAGGRDTTLDLTLPRWSSRTTVSLEDALQGLGVTQAFTDAADFTGMTTQERLRIDSVLHQGYIKVDEDGTEAAAATAVVMGTTAGRVDPETFVADRPFLFVLHDTAHGTPLFLGRVTDPTG